MNYNADGKPLCPIHYVAMMYSHDFVVDGVTLEVHVCPFGEHVEFVGKRDDDDRAAGELVPVAA